MAVETLFARPVVPGSVGATYSTGKIAAGGYRESSVG